MVRTASAGAALTAESTEDGGETPAAATAKNGTATDTEAPANGTGDGTSNQAANDNSANDATACQEKWSSTVRRATQVKLLTTAPTGHRQPRLLCGILPRDIISPSSAAAKTQHHRPRHLHGIVGRGIYATTTAAIPI